MSILRFCAVRGWVRVVGAAGFLLLSAAGASGVTLAELRRNPLWMPEATALTQDITFGDGARVKAGRRVRIYSLDNKVCRLWFPDGRSTFSVDPAATTLLRDADALVAGLTPAQRQLSPGALRGRKDLWPLQVTLKDAQDYNDGTKLPAGAAFLLVDFDGRKVKILERKKRVLYLIEPSATDFYSACLDAVVTPPPASRLYRELAPHVADSATLGPVDFLADGGPQYLAVYYAAGWCPYCAQTSPDVVEWYAGLRRENDNRFALLIVSRDKSVPEMKAHLAKLGVPALVLPFDKAGEAFLLSQADDVRSLPSLFVVDRRGEVVIPGGAGMPKDRTLRVINAAKRL